MNSRPLDPKSKSASAHFLPEAGMRETQAKLEQLERQDWWRWGAALIIMLVVTLGVLVLSIPSVRQDIFSLNQIDIATHGLLAMVLIFDVFAVYQQVLITRSRRELANQIGMNAALEVLRPPTAAERMLQENRRNSPRFYVDQRVKVKRKVNGKDAIVYGRTRDISEGGLGAVIAEPMNLNEKVVLEFSLSPTEPLMIMDAVVCHRRWFHHGFAFLQAGPTEAGIVRRFCQNANKL